MLRARISLLPPADRQGLLVDTMWTPVLQVCAHRLQVSVAQPKESALMAHTSLVECLLGMCTWPPSGLGDIFMNSTRCLLPVPNRLPR